MFLPLSVNLRWPKKTVQEEEEKGSASLCLSSTERPRLGFLRDAAGSQKKFYVCPSCLSCFRRAIGGRRCYCWGGPGGPGTTAARRGWRAPGEAAKMEEYL